MSLDPTEPIPRPPGLPLLGHLHQVVGRRLIDVAVARGQDFGGVFELNLGGRKVVVASSPEIVGELSDPKRFRKTLGPGLTALRVLAGDGLFTAHTHEPNWALAHRILTPAFSQRAVRGYFDVIRDVATELVDKWRARSGHDVAVGDDMTRLTLDSIALAGFGYRFDSFRAEALHPFVLAMNRVLRASMTTFVPPALLPIYQWRTGRQIRDDVASMNALVDEIIRERRRAPREANDLLNLMLTARDPETGAGLSDENIRYQVLTFLIAGHETTSGWLAFAIYLLMRHPAVLARAYAEVDAVLPGDTRPEHAHLAKLDVIDRVLKEALRLFPTAPAYSVAPYEDTTLAGRYRLPRDQRVVVILAALHRNADAWPDPETFDIDRFLPEAEAARHPHAYKPFGSGRRICIGRQFALTEARLTLAMVLQHFALSDPRDYQLKVKQNLTIKPEGLTLRVRTRRPRERLNGNHLQG